MDRKCFLAAGVLLVGAYALWNIYQSWRPTFVLNQGHYLIYSSASKQAALEAHRALEAQYEAYRSMLRQIAPQWAEDHQLKLKLFADREEFRRYTLAPGWAEGFYSYPFSYQYYSAKGRNHVHWMLHEAVHQLNAEVARLPLEKWLEEGLATYFSTSVQNDSGPQLGKIDPQTYPVWWLSLIAVSGDLQTDIANGSVIPLKAIISNRGGPDINRKFNLYYLHWWSLVHFLLEGRDSKHRAAALRLIGEGGGPAAFIRQIGPIDEIQTEWYEHVLALKRTYERQAEH